MPKGQTDGWTDGRSLHYAFRSSTIDAAFIGDIKLSQSDLISSYGIRRGSA